VSLSVKRSDQPTFNPEVNQELVTSAYEYCGPLAEACTPGDDGRFHLTIVMPSLRLACFYQADAVVGPPLAVVGPNGSYYTNAARTANGKPSGRSTLIGANNGSVSECRPPQPVADAALDCSVGGFVLSLWNRGDIEATFEVTVTGGATPQVETFDIEGGGEAAPAVTREILMLEGETRTIRVTADGVEIMNEEFTRECELPAATITHDCESDQAVIELTNGGENPATVNITFNGAASAAVIPAATNEGLGTATVTFPLEEGEAYTVTVTDATNDGALLATASWRQTCEVLAANITSECVESTNTGLVSVGVTNDGEEDAAITVTRDGTEIDSFTVAAGTGASREYAHQAGVPATFAVNGPSGELAATEVDVACVSPSVIERPRTSPPAASPAPESSAVALPETGAGEMQLLTALAGALLMAGGLLLGLSTRRPSHVKI
jgi:LPXTG-motif cell wall-anchored protein